MGNRCDTSSGLREGLALLLSVGAGTAYYWIYFADLFPLWEFREWVTWPVDWDYARELLLNLATGENLGFARHASMLYVRLVGHHCGPEIRCLNLWMLVPASGAAALLYILARQIRFTRSFAIGAVLMWWFSAPVADAFGWQATINDRLALLFVLATLCLSIRIIDAPVGVRACAVGNLAVSIPLILAYNSKESAWFLAPSLVLAVLILRSGGLRRRLGGLLLFVMPLGYAAYNNVRYFFLGLSGEAYWASHVLGEDVSESLPFLVMGLFGLRATGFAVLVGLILALVSALTLHPSSRRRIHEAVSHGSTAVAPLLWCAATFAVAMAIPMRARFQALYYLYLPEAFFALSMLGLLAFLIDALGAWRRARALTGCIVGAIAIALLAQFQFSSSVGPRRMAGTYTENFDQTLEFLVVRLTPEQLGDVNFVGHPSNRRAHAFFAGPTRRSLFRHHLSGADLAAIPESPIKRLRQSQCERAQSQDGRRVPPICVTLNARMGIESVRQGDRDYWFSN